MLLFVAANVTLHLNAYHLPSLPCLEDSSGAPLKGGRSGQVFVERRRLRSGLRRRYNRSRSGLRPEALARDAEQVSEAFVVKPGEGRALQIGNLEAVVLAEAASTSGEFSLLQTQTEPHHFGPPLHLHRDAAEAFYVLDGTYLMFFQDRQELCPPGTFVYVPRNTAHTFRVISDESGKKLNLFTPAAMVGYFEELSSAQSLGEATPELLDAIAQRNHMEVLGPVPETYL